MTNPNSNPLGNPVITGLTNGTTVPSSVGIQQSSEVLTAFERFEALARQVVQVSKDEMDEARGNA
jgi:hypothetical protein